MNMPVSRRSFVTRLAAAPLAAANPPVVRKGLLAVPSGPGLGLEIDPEFLKENLAGGETFWA